MTEIEKILDKYSHYGDYLKYRMDILGNDYFSWQGSRKYQLPTFEYYYQNCVIEKGGKYDFTQRNYQSCMTSKELNVKDSIIDKTIKVNYQVKYSMWMGTAFNFENVIK
jgi:hypothetical protein